MSAKDYLKKILIHSCIYFTAATFLLLFLYFALSLDLSAGIHPAAQICIFPFAFLLATANVFFKYALDWGIGWRVSIHYCLTRGGAFICLYLPNKTDGATGSQGLVLFVVMTVLYAIIMGTVLGVRARIHRVVRDESKYKSLYRSDAAKKKGVSDKNGKSDKKQKDEYTSVFKRN